jgi:cobyrinic acid a,c-diamide synthase
MVSFKILERAMNSSTAILSSWKRCPVVWSISREAQINTICAHVRESAEFSDRIRFVARASLIAAQDADREHSFSGRLTSPSPPRL